jgi:hypothetical protein
MRGHPAQSIRKMSSASLLLGGLFSDIHIACQRQQLFFVVYEKIIMEMEAHHEIRV